MNTTYSQTGSISIRKGEAAFIEGQDVKALTLLTQGKFEILISPFENISEIDEKNILQNSYRIFDLEQQTFIGTCSMLLGEKYFFTYRSTGDSILFDSGIQNAEQLRTLINAQNDFRSNIVNCISSYIGCSCKALDDLNGIKNKLQIMSHNLSIYYWLLREKLAVSQLPSSDFLSGTHKLYHEIKVGGFSLPSDINSDFFEKSIVKTQATINGNILKKDLSRIELYKHIDNLPSGISRRFFGSDPYIAYYSCTDASECLLEVSKMLKDAVSKIHKYLFEELCSEGNECLLSEYYKLAMYSGSSSSETGEVIRAIRNITVKIKEVLSLLESQYGMKFKVDVTRFNEICSSHGKAVEGVNVGDAKDAESVQKIPNSINTIPDELKGSLESILAYSGIPEAKANEFRSAIYDFSALIEGDIPESEFKSIRDTASPVFFEIYKAVLKRVLTENNKSRLYNMFLNFGYMDEKLLTTEQVNSLYRLSDTPHFQGNTSVYSMKDWFEKIYLMEKDPSIDEFGLDYHDTFRRLKKRGEIRNNEKSEYLNNSVKRLDFEIDNMFKTNHKICHGHINSYFPVLNRTMIVRELSSAVVASDAVNEILSKILEVDFSAFYRELSYFNPEKGIEKEFVMKAVIPDIILIPIYGSRVMMWQELSGRDRSTPGRFILPVFTDENLYDLMVRLVGNFRWELCRTMMGVSWNDITQSSLTSEYTDYIQFYKKDRSLSEAAKSRIKSQVQKSNGMLRDIFTNDYEIWINYESKGIIRLNKIARNILYNHCPFSKPIRDHLEKFPAFSETASRFKIKRAKKSKELERHYQKLVKSGTELDKEQEENLKFFKEM